MHNETLGVKVMKAVIGEYKLCDNGYLCRYYDIYPMHSVAFIACRIVTLVTFATC